jgi:hypothetical protein
MSNREFSVAEVFPVSPPQWFKDCLDEMRYLRIMEEGVIKEIFREGGLKIAFTDEEFEDCALATLSREGYARHPSTLPGRNRRAEHLPILSLLLRGVDQGL